MTLYLKYRPQTIDELDLESVRNSIKRIALSGKIPHALLLSGPKGTGKTSAARILAKIANCENFDITSGEPCNKCEQCQLITKGHNIDVIELDAASNRRIDDIRALRENIALSPSRARKKVYIIDEAHMLTIEASNAFLKTLEEPPSHVIFILATTEPQKLPETIRSRLTTLHFKKASFTEISRQLNRVIKGEKLRVEDGVVEEIAKTSDGSFRDAVKILESVSLGKKRITKKEVKRILLSGEINVESFLKLFSERDSQKIFLDLKNILDSGVSVKFCLERLIDRLHQALLAKEGIKGEDLSFLEKFELIDLIELLLEVRSALPKSSIPELPLEIAIIRWCSLESQKKETPPPGRELENKNPKKFNRKIKSVSEIDNIDEDKWNEILREIKAKDTTIEALLRAARPLNFDGQNLMIGVYYRFHKERLEVVQNKSTLEAVVTETLGTPVRITYELTEKEKPLKKNKDLTLSNTSDQDIIEAAKEIFGDV